LQLRECSLLEVLVHVSDVDLPVMLIHVTVIATWSI
jgi:hypothetical protein